jgi:Rhodanese-related sulfurtransferase
VGQIDFGGYMGYAHPEVLVDTEWVVNHLKDPKVKIVEVDYDPNTAYFAWHIPGASLLTWKDHIRHPVRRDFVEPEQFAKFMEERGISNDTTVVLYGDYNNWFAAYAFWVFKVYGHDDVKLLNGGRTKWAKENRPTCSGHNEPHFYREAGAKYTVKRVDWGGHRVYSWEILQRLNKGEVGKDLVLVDARSPREYTGEITAPPEYPNEHAQVGGHIPGALNIPWSLAVNQDTSEFKPVNELRRLYEQYGVTPDKEVITYCRIAERASHTWFVLKYLLGYPSVRVYDGSWAEWGNMVGVPIKKGQES